jgi:threonine/homoserine/homoserine lactone efflux protein
MEILQTFWLAFVFSFMGSIPPGSLNLTMMQLGLDHKINVAWKFAIAAALIEYPYAWLAIEFEDILTSSDFVKDNFQLLTGLVMLALGAVNLLSLKNPGKMHKRFKESGFARGILLSILNPLALPFWIGITAYLKSLGWISLDTSAKFHSYLFGISLGALTLLICFAYLARKLISYFKNDTLLKKIPGFTLLLLGVYALYQYLD